jgi:putative ABC transport system substrate-binding protein
MRLIGLAVVLTFSLLLTPLAAGAQHAGKVPRVGFLDPGSSSDPLRQRRFEVFRQSLRELGYVDGQSIAIESRWAEGQYDRCPALAADLIRLRVDVIVVRGGEATKAVQSATRTIPIVMSMVMDPVGSGIVPSLARPGETSRGPLLWPPI